MQTCDIEQRGERLRITVHRRGSARVWALLALCALLLAGGYPTAPELRDGDAAWWGAAVAGLGLLLYLLARLRQAIRPQVWLIDLAAGRIEHDGRAVERLAGMQRVEVERRSGVEIDVVTTAFLVPDTGRPLRIARARGADGAEVEALARRLAAVTGLALQHSGD